MNRNTVTLRERITLEAVRRHLWTIVLVIGLAIAAIYVLNARSTSGQGNPEPLAPLVEVNGNPAVYQRISAMTDCAALQAEFDTAEANHGRDLDSGKLDLAVIDTSYMSAADDRMRAINCY
jgi:hypothetical protein